MNVFELFGTIAIDHSDAERSIDKTVGHAREAESALEKTFKRIGGYVAAAFSAAAVVNFGKTCTQVFASVAAEESAFAQIMGDYADTAQKKLEAVADQTGVTSTRMTGAMTSLTAKFKGLGYGVEDATTLASDGLLIAADAAAFWDMSLDESMSHLNSFINGSYEGGEAIGLFANDTQMAAYAIEKGIVADAKAWAQLDEATKQATRLDFAKTMQQQSGATGQAAKEADSYANVMANLQESWRQLQAVIGKPILEKFVLPAMRKLNEYVPVLTESVSNGIEWLSGGFDKIAAYFSDVFTEDGLEMDALPNAIRSMFRDVVRKIPSLLSNVGQSIRNAWTNTVWPAVQGAFKMAFGVELPEWSDIESAVVNWWNGGNGIAAEIAKVCNWTLNLFGAPADVTEQDVMTVLNSWWTGAQGLVEDFCTWTLKLFNNPTAAIADVEGKVREWWPGVRAGAESALDWTLKLFGVPAASAEGVKNLVSGWWQGVKTAAQNALIWTLKLFNNPKETAGEIATRISTWWAGVQASAQNALNWVLKLFTNPREAADDVEEFVSGWWQGVRSGAEAALDWVLKMFDTPDTDAAIATVTDWWNGVEETLKETLGIDLSNVNIAGVFTSAEDAIGSLIETAKTFYSDIVGALETDADGKILLDGTLSNLFDAGVGAMQGLLTTTSTLVAEIAGSITGNEADAQKVGAFFNDLFGWAGEIAIGVKDDVLAILNWFVNNGELLKSALAGIAIAVGGFALSNPVSAGITALVGLIAALTTDWGNFEENYPNLVDAFERLTGLDFTTVASSMTELKSGLTEVVTWFAENEDALTTLLVLLGGLAMATGHPLAGAALITTGGFNVWQEAQKEENQEGLRKAEVTAERMNNADSPGEYFAAWGDYLLGNVDDPLNENGSMASRSQNTFDALLSEIEHGTHGSGDEDQGAFLAEATSSLAAWNRLTTAEMENMWDAYRTAKISGQDFEADPYMERIRAEMDALFARYGMSGEAAEKQQDAALITLMRNMQRLSLDTENLPVEWFTYPQNGIGGNNGASTKKNVKDLIPGSTFNTLLQTLSAQMEQVQSAARAGAQEAISNLTITANVDTGNVTLDTGVLAGVLAPRINFQLGALNARSSRG